MQRGFILVCCSLSQSFDPARHKSTSSPNRLLGTERQLPASAAAVNNIETGLTACLQVVAATAAATRPNDRAPGGHVCWAKRSPAPINSPTYALDFHHPLPGSCTCRRLHQEEHPSCDRQASAADEQIAGRRIT